MTVTPSTAQQGSVFFPCADQMGGVAVRIIKTLCFPVHLLPGWSLLSPPQADTHMFSVGKDVRDARCVGGTFGWVDEETVSENVTLQQAPP